MLNSLPPSTSTTFDEYARVTIIPHVQALTDKYKRTDIVFDVYLPSSLKSETRQKRGTGAWIRVAGTNKTQKHWKNFMRDSKNKSGLFISLRTESLTWTQLLLSSWLRKIFVLILKSGWTINLHAATKRWILVCLYMPGMWYRKATKSLWLRQMIQMLIS